TISFTGAGSVTQAGAGFTFNVTGNATLNALGVSSTRGPFTAAGSIVGLSQDGTATGNGAFTVIFNNNDVLVGQISASLGGSAAGTGTLTITGGTGVFAGGSGSFNLAGSGVSTGPLSSNIQASGTGSISLPAAHVSVLYAGSMAHLASGGGWKTTIT